MTLHDPDMNRRLLAAESRLRRAEARLDSQGSRTPSVSPRRDVWMARTGSYSPELSSFADVGAGSSSDASGDYTKPWATKLPVEFLDYSYDPTDTYEPADVTSRGTHLTVQSLIGWVPPDTLVAMARTTRLKDDIGEWVIVASEASPIVRVRLLETLWPGKSASARLVHWDYAGFGGWVNYQPAIEVRVRDVQIFLGSTSTPRISGWNFGLKDEIFQAVWQRDYDLGDQAGVTDANGDAVTRSTTTGLGVNGEFELIGSWGLVRQARAIATSSVPLLPAATSGKATIVSAESVEVTLSPTWAPASPWFDAEQMVVEFDRAKGKWFQRGVANRRMRATANASIAVGASGNVTLSNGIVVSAQHTWMAGSTAIGSGKQLIVEWMSADGYWLITAAAC